MIADAQLASTAPTDFGGALVAFMNPGGIRADLTFNQQSAGEAPGQITYSEMFTVQPFSNVMNVKTMTGRRSTGCSSSSSTTRGRGDPAAAGVEGLLLQLRLHPRRGQPRHARQRRDQRRADHADRHLPRRDEQLPRDGGDGFTVFNEGTNQLGGEIDIDAAVNYFLKNSPIAPGPRDRVTRLG